MLSKQSLLAIIFTLISFFSVLATPLQAQTNSNSDTQTDIASEAEALGFFSTSNNLGDFIIKFIDFAIIFGSISALVFLVWGGVEWVTSGGDKGKYESARNKITAAIVGLGVLATVFVIWQILIFFLGLNRIPQLETPALNSGSNSTTNSRTTTQPNRSGAQP